MNLLLYIQHSSSGQWFRVLMENNITHQMTHASREVRPSWAKVKHPEVNWERTWSLATKLGLPTHLLSFIWKIIHDLLPFPTRLFRLQMPNIMSDICNLCNQHQVGDLTHCLLQCPYTRGICINFASCPENCHTYYQSYERVQSQRSRWSKLKLLGFPSLSLKHELLGLRTTQWYLLPDTDWKICREISKTASWDYVGLHSAVFVFLNASRK